MAAHAASNAVHRSCPSAFAFSAQKGIDGYTLTLSCDNGTVARMPFFGDRSRKTLWSEGRS